MIFSVSLPISESSFRSQTLHKSEAKLDIPLSYKCSMFLLNLQGCTSLPCTPWMIYLQWFLKPKEGLKLERHVRESYLLYPHAQGNQSLVTNMRQSCMASLRYSGWKETRTQPNRLHLTVAFWPHWRFCTPSIRSWDLKVSRYNERDLCSTALRSFLRRLDKHLEGTVINRLQWSKQAGTHKQEGRVGCHLESLKHFRRAFGG